MNMSEIKKLNEVKPGDTLYCIAYNLEDDKELTIVELTVKEVVTDGPRVKDRIYSREAIIINEKVPNSPEPAGEFIIDQYYRGEECATHMHDIYTTFSEAVKAASEELKRRINYVTKEIESLQKRRASLLKSTFVLCSDMVKIL